MDIDWHIYQNSTVYHLRTSIHHLDRQSEGLKKRFYTAVKESIVWISVVLLAVLLFLWLANANLSIYGLSLIGVGALTLAWTPFRLYIHQLSDVAAVPDDRKGDTPHQERVSLVSRSVSDAGVGFILVLVGYIIRIAFTHS